MQNEMQNDKKSENIKRLNCHMEFWLCSLFLYPVLDIPNSTVSIFRKTLLMNLRHDVPSITSGYGLVAMTFTSHAKGREFDPHYPYVYHLLCFFQRFPQHLRDPYRYKIQRERLQLGAGELLWLQSSSPATYTHNGGEHLLLLPTHLAVHSWRSGCMKIRPPGIEPGTIWFLQNLQSDALPTEL